MILEFTFLFHEDERGHVILFSLMCCNWTAEAARPKAPAASSWAVTSFEPAGRGVLSRHPVTEETQSLRPNG